MNAQEQDPFLASIRTFLMKAPGWQQLDVNIRIEANRCIIMNDILYVWVLEQRSVRMKRKMPRILDAYCTHSCCAIDCA